MINYDNVKFGRLAPIDRSHEDKYPFTKAVAMTAKTVERVLPLPALRSFYNQGYEGACVGYSVSWMESIYNSMPQQRYDARWLYRQAQQYDKDPNTIPGQDTGTYVWAAMWVLQHLGHKKLTKSRPDLNDGVLSYYWGRGADNARTAIALGRPVVVGTNWYESFCTPEYYNGEWWIGRNKNDLGRVRGGHAYCINGASDKRQACKFINTWGMIYPPAWIPYEMVDRLISENGEEVIAIDNPKVT